MRVIVTEGPLVPFEIDFTTGDTKTHDALAPHRDEITTILENARLDIIGLIPHTTKDDHA